MPNILRLYISPITYGNISCPLTKKKKKKTNTNKYNLNRTMRICQTNDKNTRRRSSDEKNQDLFNFYLLMAQCTKVTFGEPRTASLKANKAILRGCSGSLVFDTCVCHFPNAYQLHGQYQVSKTVYFTSLTSANSPQRHALYRTTEILGDSMSLEWVDH